jgi:hypothetical protein
MAEGENSRAPAVDKPYGSVRPLFRRTNAHPTKPKQEQPLAGPQVPEDDDDDPGPTAA